MKEGQDAFGHEIYDHFQGKEAVEFIERDDGYLDTSAGPAVYFSSFDEWPEHEQEAMKYVQGRVLDIGCGAGRHSLHLQTEGYDVLGIDISPLAVEVCRLRGVRDVRLLPVTRVSADLGCFDTILMLGNNFGLFANAKRTHWLLRRFNRITSANGRIIAGSLDIYQTSNPDHLAYQAQNRQRSRLSGELRLRVRYKRYIGNWFDYLMVSQGEMRQLLEGSGWQVDRFIDSDTPSYVAIIQKTS